MDFIKILELVSIVLASKGRFASICITKGTYIDWEAQRTSFPLGSRSHNEKFGEAFTEHLVWFENKNHSLSYIYTVHRTHAVMPFSVRKGITSPYMDMFAVLSE